MAIRLRRVKKPNPNGSTAATGSGSALPDADDIPDPDEIELGIASERITTRVDVSGFLEGIQSLWGPSCRALRPTQRQQQPTALRLVFWGLARERLQGMCP